MTASPPKLILYVTPAVRAVQIGPAIHLTLAQKGSHRQFKHETKPSKVTVAGRPSLDLDMEIVVSIYKQAGWEKDW